MKVSQLLKVLEEDGWYLRRHGKKHDIYVHPTKEDFLQLPRHPSSELKKGTEESILKKAGLK
ncbi:type II toxin-antitoxin system HicA family toxin [Chryseobacterium sp. 2R14A]|uniref:type II toxin-antitoxin system HicA family toxin n=1 Tax=Chryseobacterium sp. 2R14A TaxID=3380353 RepID=UPI003CF406A1